MQRRRGRPTPGLVLVQGENRIRVELANVKAVVAALAGGAAGPSRDRVGDCPREYLSNRRFC